ncbi:uncharacterized protein BCR38DRAFT_461393 [Pseudomassariella vexata]|uniref:FAD-binding PCMH-type domain-containing protein n=1 Tax=Pseudomassariella vexata TaxID=1141098 RepID=A0A1Y2DD93_9PEZI|nr:uncharacterized protein BCR38DRAFT_461393 [Pseudomassariella vexata]ORY57253.1 hypothetical protein BCR38DRAFT_461393 [Pseudomassariella vexata]
MSVRKLVSLGLTTMAASMVVSPHNAGEVLPGDAAWPKAADWASLNKTINGHLIASVPLPNMCATIQTTINQPAEFLNMYFNNYTCDSFTPKSKPCELGNYVSYVVNVTGAADVQAAIAFAKKNNVRLVIKNTGQDLLGKSTGKGGLSLWTHNLKSTRFIPHYSESYYKGPAIKLGAGIKGFEAYAAANAAGHSIIGGSCPTVGIAGGYSQGGGHSILSSMYGLGADNTALGETPEQNSDLYWAMSGGGTYAVALSMTSRLHPDDIFGGASVTFNDSKVGNDAFWEAVGAFHSLLPAFVDAGNSYTYTLTNNVFLSWGVTMPGADLNKVNALMQPFLDDLVARGIEYQYTPHAAASYYEHFNYYLGPLPEGIADYAPFTGNRILPCAMFVDPEKRPGVMDAVRNASLAEGYGPLPCQALNVSDQAHPSNAVLPAWRDALSVCLTPSYWDAATPGGGVYLNEVNYQKQNWQKEFYGSNYPKPLSVKNKYDPEALLYAHTAVGSEKWTEDGSMRLCRT